MACTRRCFLAGATGLWAASVSSQPAPDGGPATEDGVYELRQYTLRAGQRETLIDLFERHFVEPQNEVGAHVLGTFRDLDDPDRFVWIRGFADMAARHDALESFYGGPVWHAHRAAANATMVDSDNVLLLRPSARGTGLSRQATRPPAAGIVGATIYYLGSVEPDRFAAFFRSVMLPHLKVLGVEPLASLASEESPNTFSRLPVRQHERVFLWLARWPDLQSHEAFRSACSRISGWRDDAPEAVLPALMRKPEQLRLMPTARSVLR